MKKFVPLFMMLLFILNACTENDFADSPAQPSSGTENSVPAARQAPPSAGVPDFDHIITIYFENHDYDQVIGNDDMPYSHYNFLKTILSAWDLPDLGFTSNPASQAITVRWR